MTFKEVFEIKITELDGKFYLITRQDPTAREFNTALELYEFLKPKILNKYTEELKLLKYLLGEI